MELEQEIPTSLKEVTQERVSKVNGALQSNPFFLLDKGMEIPHELLVQNKENIQDNDSSDSVSRIWVGWNPAIVQVTLVHHTSQVIFVDVSTSSSMSFVDAFVYGDFNSILNPSEKVGGSAILSCHYEAFSICIQQSFLLDLPYSGCFYTWTNCQQDGTIIRSKLDRVVVNMEWISQFQLSKADFLLPGISDHSPSVVSVFTNRVHGPPPFKSFNFLTDEPDFMDLVNNVWNIQINGNPMYVLVIKLKLVKKRIIPWKKLKFRNVYEKMHGAQAQLQACPLYTDLARREREYVAEYVKSRNNILSLNNDNNVTLTEDKDIAKVCIEYYSDLFKCDYNSSNISDSSMGLNFNSCIQQDDIVDLIKDVTREEVVLALNSIGSSKAPGRDGFSNHFFKSCWNIVGNDFVAAIQNFFSKSKLLKEINSTFIIVIAKKKNPSVVYHFRPIS
ncbi:uncharacterized protein LOC113341371 [Papaver somniferum]|uniref:uncharacterized protein LOC113341371 n=1 Tax=Papaver somniferum TaxID=3469 RepID=UPI000E70324B|nr:uncharacterized protein LOC113341371 [Papaver somniferum]